MRRGTTPTLTFNLPFQSYEYDYVEIYFAQNDELLFEKKSSDCVIEGNTLQVRLTQEDTYKLNAEEKLEIQLRFGFPDGSVDATDIIKCKVKDILDEEVMEWQSTI